MTRLLGWCTAASLGLLVGLTVGATIRDLHWMETHR